MTDYYDIKKQTEILKYAYANIQIENKKLQQQIKNCENTLADHKKVIKSLNIKWKQKNDIINNIQNEYNTNNMYINELIKYLKTSLSKDVNNSNILDIVKNCMADVNKSILYKKFVITIINLLNSKKFIDSMLYNFNIIINAIETKTLSDHDINVLIDNLLIAKDNNIIVFDTKTSTNDNKTFYENPDNLAPEYKIYFECYGYPTTEIEFNNIDKEQLELIKNELNNKML